MLLRRLDFEPTLARYVRLRSRREKPLDVAAITDLAIAHLDKKGRRQGDRDIMVNGVITAAARAGVVVQCWWQPVSNAKEPAAATTLGLHDR